MPVSIVRKMLPLLILALACTSADRDTSAAATSADSTPSPDVAAPLASDSGPDPYTDSIVAAIRSCPRDGLWHACSVERRLELSGLRPRLVDSVTRIPGIALDAQLWQIGRQSLRVVLFESDTKAAAAMATLDSARAAPIGDGSVVWPERPTVIRSANLVALMLGGSDRQIERVSNALTAGPPQP